MLSTDPEYNRRLWEAALRSAAGPLSAYITPTTFGLSVFQLSSDESQIDAAFQQEIQARLDFGRALQIADTLELATRELTSAYAHSLTYCQGRIEGKIHVPRLILERSNRSKRGIPVLRAARHLFTPENLLASEVLILAMRVARYWSRHRGAEGILGSQLLARLQSLDARHPWAELRTVPRDHLGSLASIVRGRIRAGWCSPSSAMARLVELAAPHDSVGALLSASGPLSFLAAQDNRFADKLFELLCIGWLVRSLTKLFRTHSIQPMGIRDSSIAIWSGKSRAADLTLHFQAGFASRHATWKWGDTGQSLRAIPDFLFTIKSVSGSAFVLLDAKNRASSADSEVMYKMLGYKENLRFNPFVALALFPEFEAKPIVRTAFEGPNRVILARIPLSLSTSSHEFVRLATRLARHLVSLKGSAARKTTNGAAA